MNDECKFYPKVSIVIPVYNGANYMREAIDSALAQTYDNIEVIVVNDGSTDNTEEIALSYGDKIRYFSKSNGGVATALNMAIENMHGEYFSWLSHDDVYFPNKIEAQINMLSEYGDYEAVVFSGFVYIDDKSKQIPRLLPTDKYTEEELSRPLFPVLYGMGGCCFLIHKSHFNRVGFFDEALRMTQDYDLWFRVLRGKPAICYPDALVMLRVHREQTGRKSGSEFSNESDKLWINIMESLSEQEMCDLNGSRYYFFKKIYQHLYLYSPYGKSAVYAKNRMYEALESESNSRNWSILRRAQERFSLLGVGYRAAIGEFVLSLRKVGIFNTIKRCEYALLRTIKKYFS